jgi:hypothetical protein
MEGIRAGGGILDPEWPTFFSGIRIREIRGGGMSYRREGVGWHAVAVTPFGFFDRSFG